MAEAYPAFDLKNNRTPGSGSGPMGGPGAFAPGNTPVIYGKNQSPLDGFMQAIGVSKVENGQAYGSTGGAVHMWDSERQGFQALAAAQQEQEAKQRQAQGGQRGQAQQTQQTQNAFLPGAPTATGDVRFNGLTPAAPGGTPLLGRDYGSVNAAGKAPNASFGLLAKEISLADGPVKRNGALFEYQGAGKGFSLTQDPSTVPAAGGASTVSPEAMAVISQGVGQFKGADATNQFIAALDAGAFDQKPLDGATQQQIAALNLRNQQVRQEAKAALPRLMLPNTGNATVDAERMKTFMGAADNAFMPKPSATTGAVNKLANQATGTTTDYTESITAMTDFAKKNGQVVTTQVQIDRNGRPTIQATFHDAKTLDDGNKKKFDELSRERTAIVSRLSAIDTNVVNNATAGPMKGNVDKERKRLAKIEADLNDLLPGSVVPYGQEAAGGTATPAQSNAPALAPGSIYSDASGNLAKFKGGDPKDPKNWEQVAR